MSSRMTGPGEVGTEELWGVIRWIKPLNPKGVMKIATRLPSPPVGLQALKDLFLCRL